jgi:molybdate transport system substrate-binding protein
MKRRISFTRYSRAYITNAMRATIAVLLVLITISLSPRASIAAKDDEITVSAAISLKEALTDAASKYVSLGGDHVVFNFGASGALEAQIKQGAPVDLFISAGVQVDELIAAGQADRSSRRVIARNALVLVVPIAAKDPPRGFDDLLSDRVHKIAIGEPKAVPAGTYAMQTLTALHLAEPLRDRLVFGANVRQVLDYVRRDEIDAGIVYATDAASAKDQVKVVATADPTTHEPIEYPAVVITGSTHAAAAGKFLDFLVSTEAQGIFAARGFESPSATSQPTR